MSVTSVTLMQAYCFRFYFLFVTLINFARMVLSNDVCERYARCKISLGGELQVSWPVWFHCGACLCALDQALPLPHVAGVVLRRLWNLDLGSRSSCHYCVLALRNPIVNRGYRSPRVERPVESGEVCTPSNSTTVPRLCTV